MTVTSAVHKTTFSIRNRNWEKIKDIKNRSNVVNQALDLYFQKQEFMNQAEKQWQDKMIQEGLDDLKNGNYVEVDFDGNNIDDVTSALWDKVAA